MNTWKTFIWPLITVIALFLGWMLVNAGTVVDNISTFKTWYGSSKSMSGIWDNSTSHMIAPPEYLTSQDQFVRAEFIIKDSLLDGQISTTALKKVLPYEFILLRGKKAAFRDSVDAVAFEYINGKEVIFAKLHITLSDDILTIQNKSYSGTSFIPKESKLIKSSNIAFPGIQADLERAER